MKIIKRDGTINNFEVDKIKNAISKACQEIGKDMSDSEILNIVMNSLETCVTKLLVVIMT